MAQRHGASLPATGAASLDPRTNERWPSHQHASSLAPRASLLAPASLESRTTSIAPRTNSPRPSHQTLVRPPATGWVRLEHGAQSPDLVEDRGGGGKMRRWRQRLEVSRLAESGVAVLSQAIDNQIADFRRVRDAGESADVTAAAMLAVSSAAGR